MTLKRTHVLKRHVHHIIPCSRTPQSHTQLKRFSVSGLQLPCSFSVLRAELMVTSAYGAHGNY